jgi:hypothetical protein
MDYLGVEEQARQLYQQFKFAVIARLEPNSEWMLGAKAWMRGANS